jgi:hypothetical protein
MTPALSIRWTRSVTTGALMSTCLAGADIVILGSACNSPSSRRFTSSAGLALHREG